MNYIKILLKTGDRKNIQAYFFLKNNNRKVLIMNRKRQKITTLTANCNKSFVVSPEQSKEFSKHKFKNGNKNKILLSKITSKLEKT